MKEIHYSFVKRKNKFIKHNFKVDTTWASQNFGSLWLFFSLGETYTPRASILKQKISDGMWGFAPVIILGYKIGCTNNCSYKQLIVAAVSHLWV